MPSYQYSKSQCGDKTILQPSYLHNRISYIGKMASLYWIRALVPFSLHDTCDKRLSWPDEGVSPVAPHMKWSCPLPPKCDYNVTCVLIVISCQNQYTSHAVIALGWQCLPSSKYSSVISNEICKWFCCASQAPYQDVQCNMPVVLLCFGLVWLYYDFMVVLCYLFTYIHFGFPIGHGGNCMIVLSKMYGHKGPCCGHSMINRSFLFMKKLIN